MPSIFEKYKILFLILNFICLKEYLCHLMKLIKNDDVQRNLIANAKPYEVYQDQSI